MSTILGIDFGAQNACVMTVRDGHTVCVLNAESKRQTPTVVSMETEHREIGTGGFTSWKRNYKNTISELKRFIGTNATDKQIETEKEYIFNAKKLVAAEDDGATAFECQYLGEKSAFFRSGRAEISGGDCVVFGWPLTKT